MTDWVLDSLIFSPYGYPLHNSTNKVWGWSLWAFSFPPLLPILLPPQLLSAICLHRSKEAAAAQPPAGWLADPTDVHWPLFYLTLVFHLTLWSLPSSSNSLCCWHNSLLVSFISLLFLNLLYFWIQHLFNSTPKYWKWPKSRFIISFVWHCMHPIGIAFWTGKLLNFFVTCALLLSLAVCVLPQPFLCLSVAPWPLQDSPFLSPCSIFVFLQSVLHAAPKHVFLKCKCDCVSAFFTLQGPPNKYKIWQNGIEHPAWFNTRPSVRLKF